MPGCGSNIEMVTSNSGTAASHEHGTISSNTNERSQHSILVARGSRPRSVRVAFVIHNSIDREWVKGLSLIVIIASLGCQIKKIIDILIKKSLKTYFLFVSSRLLAKTMCCVEIVIYC